MKEESTAEVSVADDGCKTGLTERQARERAFYEEYAQRTAVDQLSLKPVLGAERRPWNPYWFVVGLVRDARTAAPQRLLDFGCGPGDYSVMFAKLGYDVFGFDISPTNVDKARQLSEKYHLTQRTRFTVGVAEQLDYSDEFFDLVVGIDILHHVDIPKAIGEVLRVLKSDGRAIFKEPVEAPVFDRLRNTRLGRRLAPKEKSFERHMTADERKLAKTDLDLIQSAAPQVRIHRFRVLSRLDALADRFRGQKSSSALEIADARLLRYLPFTGRIAGEAVLVLQKR